MPRHNKNLNRLFVDADLSVGHSIKLDKGQTNYLLNVMRKKEGDQLILFNGRHGAFLATITDAHRKGVTLELVELVSEQSEPSDLWYFFAPLKVGRLDYMMQKATEMGVGHLQPVMTQYTQNVRLKFDKIEPNLIEAAEQCEILNIPKVHEQTKLNELLDNWSVNHKDRKLLFADEAAKSGNVVSDLSKIKDQPIALLIGPEGGFSDEERSALLSKDFCVPISLGPRILRADTAAVAGLAIVQSIIGDLR